MGAQGQELEVDQSSQNPETSRSDSEPVYEEGLSPYGFDDLKEEIESYEGWRIYTAVPGERITAINNSDGNYEHLVLERDDSNGWLSRYSINYSEREDRLGPKETLEDKKTVSWNVFTSSVQEILEPGQ